MNENDPIVVDFRERLQRIEDKLDAKAKSSSPGKIDGVADEIRAFAKDRCTVSEVRRHKTADVYRAYKEWCEHKGLSPCHETTFGKSLRRCFPTIGTKYITESRSIDRHYMGIGVNRYWSGNQDTSE